MKKKYIYLVKSYAKYDTFDTGEIKKAFTSEIKAEKYIETLPTKENAYDITKVEVN